MMEHRCITPLKSGQKKLLNIFTNDAGDKVTLEYIKSKSSALISSTCTQCRPSSRINEHHGLVPGHYRFNCRISKQITSFDEQYLSRCLELIQISAAKAASFNISVTCDPSKIVSVEGLLPDGSGNNLRNRISGSETRSKGLTLCANDDISLEAISSASVKGSLDSYRYGSIERFNMCSSPRLSPSSNLSSCAWPLVSHGTLQCTWRNGIPSFVFYTDCKREVYVTRPTKSASTDWTYLIYSSTSTRKELDFCGRESGLVGRMNVSAQCRICNDNSKIMETEFILYGNNEERDLENSSYDMGKHRRLSGKVSNFFKPLHLAKHRLSNSTWGTSTSIDFCLSKPEHDEDSDSDHIVYPNFSDDKIPSNFELAAIVVKDHIQQATDVGGWGLSFLKRAKAKQLAREFSSLDHPVETSMDVILPVGYHGGPNTINTGPSTLIERWKSGGKCDCGGWDSGCPLTILNSRSDKERNDKSLHLFLKGNEGRAPSMKMGHIENGFYHIDFQSRLSSLQCFSIAVAVIHSRSPPLRPEAQTL